MNPKQQQEQVSAAVNELLLARNELHDAQVDLHKAQLRYQAAEHQFLTAAGAASPTDESPAWPDKVVIGDTVILAADEWWELKPGARLEFHTVVRL